MFGARLVDPERGGHEVALNEPDSTPESPESVSGQIEHGAREIDADIFGGTPLEHVLADPPGAADHLPAHFNNMIADKMDPAATGYGFGLGVAVRRQNGIAAMAGTAGDYYWSGVYGTYFWVDPKEQLAVVFMVAAPGSIRLRYRQMARNLVYQALAA